MLYFPWDRDQKLCDDTESFDRTAYGAMCQYAPDFNVRLWTYGPAVEFARKHYPVVWDMLKTVARPVMMIDVLRWMVVHHFGGIYWQMNTSPLVPMNDYLPSSGRSVRLFTEFDLNPEQCRIAMAEPIRQGDPEESKRVLIQVFSALPGAAFVKKVIDFQMERLRTHQPKKDYDVLFITGNALVSTAFDRYGKNDASVELINRTDSRRMIKWHYRGTWRTDHLPKAESNSLPDSSKTRPRGAGRIPLLASAYYRFFARHPHQDVAERIAAENKNHDDLALLKLWMTKHHIGTVCRLPIDLSRGFINPFYSRIPSVDLLVCTNYLESVSFAEARRILNRFVASGSRFLTLTHHLLLTESWDTALGDERPINYQLAPFHFPEPDVQIPCALPGKRSDRVLAVWNTINLARNLTKRRDYD